MQTKPEGVTTQMKALDDEYFRMLVFPLLLNKVCVCVLNFYELFGQSNMAVKGLKRKRENRRSDRQTDAATRTRE